MQVILLAWLRNVGQTLKKCWCVWLLWAIWELVKDRATNSTNIWLDQNTPDAVKFARDHMSFFPQSELGIVGWLFVLTILGIVIWAYVDTRHTYEAMLLPSSPQDVANREKITVLFRAYGAPASGELQQVAHKLLAHFRNFPTGAPRTEGYQIIAQLVHNGPLSAWGEAHSQLHKAIDGPDKVDVVGLQDFLVEFFLAYQNLVRWVIRLDNAQLCFVVESENEEPVSTFESVLKGKEFLSWQEKHKLFYQQFRELLAVDDFAKLRERVGGDWDDMFH